MVNDLNLTHAWTELTCARTVNGDFVRVSKFTIFFKVGWWVVSGCLKNYFKGCLSKCCSKCCSCKLFISLSRKSCTIISLGFFPYLSWSAIFEWGYFHFPLCLFKSRLFFLLTSPLLITLIKAFELIVCGWTTWLCVNLWVVR